MAFFFPHLCIYEDTTIQTVRFLKWIERYSGWWYLICTPKDKHINPGIMQTLITHLAKEQFYEIIFVLLMVHRDEGFVESTNQAMFVEMLMIIILTN